MERDEGPAGGGGIGGRVGSEAGEKRWAGPRRPIEPSWIRRQTLLGAAFGPVGVRRTESGDRRSSGRKGRRFWESDQGFWRFRRRFWGNRWPWTRLDRRPSVGERRWAAKFGNRSRFPGDFRDSGPEKPGTIPSASGHDLHRPLDEAAKLLLRDRMMRSPLRIGGIDLFVIDGETLHRNDAIQIITSTPELVLPQPHGSRLSPRCSGATEFRREPLLRSGFLRREPPPPVLRRGGMDVVRRQFSTKRGKAEEICQEMSTPTRRWVAKGELPGGRV